MIDSQLLADVSAAEGCRLIAYRDTLGNWTIGYGHLLDQTIDWTGHEITQATANDLLTQDLESHRTQCLGLPEYSSLDTPTRINALVECVFNLGVRHWTAEFPQTRKALQAQDWQGAATHLMQSPGWIHEVGLKRVARLADYFQNGSY